MGHDSWVTIDTTSNQLRHPPLRGGLVGFSVGYLFHFAPFQKVFGFVVIHQVRCRMKEDSQLDNILIGELLGSLCRTASHRHSEGAEIIQNHLLAILQVVLHLDDQGCQHRKDIRMRNGTHVADFLADLLQMHYASRHTPAVVPVVVSRLLPLLLQQAISYRHCLRFLCRVV